MSQFPCADWLTESEFSGTSNHIFADIGLERAQRGSGDVTGLDLLIDEMT